MADSYEHYNVPMQRTEHKSEVDQLTLLTISEVAELLKVSKSSVRRPQQGRHIPFIKVGGSIRFSKSDILEYLKKERVGAIH